MADHAGRELAHDWFGDEMELLPVAVHAPGQRPAIERDDRLVVRPARRNERRLHDRFFHGCSFGDGGRLGTA